MENQKSTTELRDQLEGVQEALKSRKHFRGYPGNMDPDCNCDSIKQLARRGQ